MGGRGARGEGAAEAGREVGGDRRGKGPAKKAKKQEKGGGGEGRKNR